MSAPVVEVRPVDRDAALRLVRHGAWLADQTELFGVSRADVMLALADAARPEPDR